MRPADAIAAAAAEGLTLARSATSKSGYWGVKARPPRFDASLRMPARFRTGPEYVYLGTFDSAEEAALTIARRFPEVTAHVAATAVEAAEDAESSTPGEVARQAAVFPARLAGTGTWYTSGFGKVTSSSCPGLAPAGTVMATEP